MAGKAVQTCWKTDIIENMDLSKEEKFLRLDKERQVCATIRLHVAQDMREQTLPICCMKDLYAELKNLAQNSAVEMCEVYLDRLSNMKWINLTDEVPLLTEFKNCIKELGDDIGSAKIIRMYLMRTWPESLKSRKDALKTRYGINMRLEHVEAEMRTIANENAALEIRSKHQGLQTDGYRKNIMPKPQAYHMDAEDQPDGNILKRKSEEPHQTRPEVMSLRKNISQGRSSSSSSSSGSGSFLGRYRELLTYTNLSMVPEELMARWRKHRDQSHREHEENRCKSGMCWMNARPLGNIPAIIAEFMRNNM